MWRVWGGLECRGGEKRKSHLALHCHAGRPPAKARSPGTDHRAISGLFQFTLHPRSSGCLCDDIFHTKLGTRPVLDAVGPIK